jgi:ribosomal protein S18 acetylase RimI-like enzyme
MAQTIRKWTTNDLPVIQNVLWKTWVEAYSSFLPEPDLKSYFSEHYDLDALTELFKNPLVSGYVAEVDGSVVGFMRTTKDWEENKYFVSSVYILPAFQKKGLGLALMRKAAEEASASRLDRVWVGVMVQNHEARQWYDRMGYVVMRTEPFMMGNSSVEHDIGYIPIESILQHLSGPAVP